ncbi:unnamed protein product [Clonostachys rhizophaga]|uniref:Zn(2)-C6 fungal-type domain-containing protein n=1 Tax=Clonostachys rhizophaga TaxID=160324 RepID=A0A9N9YJ82_9HYPO|nr:unnamed protein product [Clonostachys rhizophaga]
MDVTIEKLSNDCSEWLRRCLDRSEDAEVRAGLSNRIADFNLWCDGIGARARSRGSLDARFQSRPDETTTAPSASGPKKLAHGDRAQEDYSAKVKTRISTYTRTGQACDRCKVRKIRCDALPDGCSSCTSQAIKCFVTDRISGRTERRGYLRDLETENNSMLAHIHELEQLIAEKGVKVWPFAATVQSETGPAPDGTDQPITNPRASAPLEDGWAKHGSLWVKPSDSKDTPSKPLLVPNFPRSRLESRPEEIVMIKGMLTLLRQFLGNYEELLGKAEESEEALRNVDSALGNLALLAMAIRQTGKRSRLEKADKKFNPDDHLALRDHLEFILRIQGSPAGQKSTCLDWRQQHLIRANLRRRNRFVQAQNHSKYLKSRHDNQTAAAPRQLQSQPRLKEDSSTPENTHLLQLETKSQRMLQLQETTRRESNNKEENTKSGTSASAPDSMLGLGFEQAKRPSSGSEGPRTTTWNTILEAITLRPGNALYAKNARPLLERSRIDHKDIDSDDRPGLLSVSLQYGLGIEACPLCGESDTIDSPELIEHVLGHMHNFSLLSLPWASETFDASIDHSMRFNPSHPNLLLFPKPNRNMKLSIQSESLRAIDRLTTWLDSEAVKVPRDVVNTEKSRQMLMQEKVYPVPDFFTNQTYFADQSTDASSRIGTGESPFNGETSQAPSIVSGLTSPEQARKLPRTTHEVKDYDPKETFRIQNIPVEFDIPILRDSLSRALQLKEKNIQIHSLSLVNFRSIQAYLTATVTFATKPFFFHGRGLLGDSDGKSVAQSYTLELCYNEDTLKYVKPVHIDQHFRGFTPLSPYKDI